MTITDVVGGRRVEVVRGVADLDREVWNAVVRAAGGSVFHSWEWLAAFEEAPPGVFEPAHQLAYDGDRLVGVCPAYLVHHCPRLERIAETAGIDLGGPVLLAHSLAAFAGGPLALPEHLDALDALISGLADTAAALGAWAWGAVNLPAGRLVGRLIGAGYAAARLNTTYLLDTRHATVEDYWSTFRSKHRRELQRERRVLTQSGVRITESAPDADTHVRLVHGVVADHGASLDVLPEDFLRALHRHLAPHDRSLTAIDLSGDAIAVFAAYDFGSERSLWLAGLDVDRLDSFGPYRPMVATAVESAITAGVPLVNLGRGNPAPKRRVGAVAAPLYLALATTDRPRTALLHAALRRLERDGADHDDVGDGCC
ncbi:GNAT family N-acetyltransferase [Umezawaea sp. NPDC059074]|uniref:GNAT family N-acetyltransferase n=1 Tax=Umezawaea sp. NPDC059074 TaxID=3346716 RepID=UPI0036866A78